MTGARVHLAGNWELWRVVAVRGAGFPADGLGDLGAPAAARAAEREPGGSEHYRAVLAAEQERIVAAVEAIAEDERFQEAVLWQNRHAAHTGLRLWRERPGPAGGRNKRVRAREALVAKYWQRYCGKNDTVGFFGPVGWGRVDPAVESTSALPGPDLVERRTVGFETWCLVELARALAADDRLAAWLPPSISADCCLDGPLLHRPRQPPLRLSAAEAALLARCDGRTPARDIAHALAADPNGGVRREADVLLLLDVLRRRGIVRWDLEPPNHPSAQRRLRERLEAVGDPEVREPALAALDRLDRARAQVARAAGPRELDARLGELAGTFTDLTSRPATRAGGEVYAARTLVYLDCRRGLELTVGRDVLDALAEPLALLLQSARWLTWETRRAYEAALADLYRELALEARSARVEMAELWHWSRELLFGGGALPVDPVLAAFRARWDDLLGLDGHGDLVEVSAASLRPRAAEAFAAPRPGWPAARYHSPDVQVAATSLEDIRAGRFEAVLGELHIAWNTLDSALFVGQHPDPGELLAAVEADVPEVRVLPLLPGDWPRETVRMRQVLRRPSDLRLAIAPAPACSDHLPLAGLVVEEVEGRLRARSRDGRHDLDLIDLYGAFLSMVVADAFRVLSRGPRRPRVRIDRLTVVRRTWSFRAADIGFTSERDEAARFLQARRWSVAAGLPRYVFVQVPGELKPFFVDLEGPVSVNVLTTFVRTARERGHGEEPVTVVEMLPEPERCWLPDAEGRRYASELRLVAVDTAR